MNSTKQRSGLLVLCLLLSGPINLHAMDASSTAESRQDIEQLLRTDDLTILGADILTQGLLLEACEDHDFAPYWTNPDRIRELMELINNAADHGLKPSDYHIDALDKVLKLRLADPSAEIEAEADILLTESLFVYAYHRHFGKAKANALDPNINFRRETYNNQAPKVTLDQALESSSLIDFIETIAPTGPVYRRLQGKMEFYRDIASKGGWPTVSDGPTMHSGDSDPRVAVVRERLAATGHVDDTNQGSPLFDPALVAAMKAFQTRHQLDVDGVVGQQTITALNVPIEHRIVSFL